MRVVTIQLQATEIQTRVVGQNAVEQLVVRTRVMMVPTVRVAGLVIVGFGG